MSGGNPKRLKYYYLIAYVLPIIAQIIFSVTCIFSDNEEFFEKSWKAVLDQRMIHSFHFTYNSENFYKTFGLFEIIIKSLTLSFFLGTLFYFWKSDQELQSLNMGVHRSAESNWNKYLSNVFWMDRVDWQFLSRYFRFLSIVRKSIVGFLLFGSLIFNIFGYFTSGFEFGVKMCELDMNVMPVANLSATFEVLKRLNGVYIMIFHLTRLRLRELIKKKFGSCCRKTKPKKIQNAVKSETEDTKLWIKKS